MVLVELGVVEQRYQAVLEVLSGASVTEVARRYGVARQTVHTWLRRYGSDGLAGLVDRSSKPGSCPHQMPAEVEVRVVEMRKAHPGWGPRTIRYHLEAEGADPLPSRSGIYRALLRHNLVDQTARRKRRRGLQAVGTDQGDGVVADGHHGRCASVGWVGVEGGDRH